MSNNFRLNAKKPRNNAGVATPKCEMFLLYREDIVSIPPAGARGILTEGDIKIKSGRRFHILYTTPTTQVHSRDTEGEVDSRGWKKKITGHHPGDELEINEFVKNNVNQGFVIVVKSCQSEYMKIYGSVNNPMYFTGSFVDDAEKKGYELTFEQNFADEDPILFYQGNIIVDEDALAEIDPEFSSLFVKLDASNIDEESKNLLKKKLDIGELPKNVATVDEGEGEDKKEGTTYTKDQVDDLLDEKLATPTEEGTTTTHPYVVGVDAAGNSVKLPAGDLGKNFSNTNLTFTEHRSHNLNGKNLSFSGGKVGFGVAVPTEAVDVSGRVKADAFILNTNNSSAIANRVRTNGTFLYHANSSAIEKRLMYYDATDITNLLKSMNDGQKEEWRRALLKAGEGYSTGVPRVDFILPFKVTKEIKGVQYISVIGSNLLLNTNDCEVVLINTATRQEWRVDVINTSASTTSQFSFGIDFESIPLGSYRLRVRNGTMTNIDTTTFEIMESVRGRDLSNLTWQTWMFRSNLQNFTANGIRIHRPSKQEAVNEGDSIAQINAYKALSDIVLSESDANKDWTLIISIKRNNGFSHPDRNIGNKAGYIGIVSTDILTESLLPDYGMKWQHQDTYDYPNVGRHIGGVGTSVNSSLLFSKKGAVISVFQLINGKDTLVSTYNIVDKLPALRLLFSDGGIPNGYDLGYSVDVMIESLVVED